MRTSTLDLTKNRLRRLLASLAVAVALLTPVLGVAGLGATAHAATVDQQSKAGCNTDARFFGLVPWYRYLHVELVKANPGDPGSAMVCRVTDFGENGGNTTDKVVGRTSPILLIALAILEDLIRVAALVAVGYVVYGGIQYITSQGSPDSTKEAQQTIINALIGLAIALIAVAVVSFLGTNLSA